MLEACEFDVQVVRKLLAACMCLAAETSRYPRDTRDENENNMTTLTRSLNSTVDKQ